MKKIIIVAFIAAVVGVVVGYALTHQPARVGAVSPTGSTNTTARILSTVMSLSSSSGTTTSILIPQDQAVVSSFAYCTGVGTSRTAYTGAGLASLQINGATTSAAVTGNLADFNTNYATVGMVIGTSTVNSYASSTSESALPGTGRYLPGGVYYTFSANATNTAQCTVGVNVITL